MASDRAGTEPSAADIRIHANPAAAVLPASFTQQYGRLREILGGCREGSVCEARMLDLDRDGAPEVLVADERTVSVFKKEADGRWFEWAEYTPPMCADESKDIRRGFVAGRFETAPPVFPDLVVDGVRLRHVEGEPECPALPDPPEPAGPPVVGGGEEHGRLTHPF